MSDNNPFKHLIHLVSISHLIVDGCYKLSQDLPDQLSDQVFLVMEVIVKGPLTHVCPFGDVVDSGQIKPLFGEHRSRGGDQAGSRAANPSLVAIGAAAIWDETCLGVPYI
jgi:hypothetical protein